MTDKLELPPEVRSVAIGGLHKDLLPISTEMGTSDTGSEGWLSLIAKSDPEGVSAQGTATGVQEREFEVDRARLIRKYNPVHARSLELKTSATVMLGWVSDAVQEALDPLTEYGLADLCKQVVDDLWEVGEGYIEVVRSAEGGQITGLHYADAANVSIVVAPDTDNPADFYFQMTGDSGGPVTFKRFGLPLPNGVDENRAMAVGPDGEPPIVDGVDGGTSQDPAQVTAAGRPTGELIHFRLPARGSRYYGSPRWLSAVPKMELAHCRVQYLFDFFLNRCIPEALLLVTGPMMDDESWRKITTTLNDVAGKGNQRRTLALNIPTNGDEKAVTELVPLAGQVDTAAAGNDDLLGTETDLAVVSIHGVPPLLAGIQIPGKMAASNELTNSMMAFQVLEIAPVQKMICATLARTLGNPKVNGGLSVSAEDFTGKKEAPAPQDPTEKDLGLQPSPPKDRRGNGLRTIMEEIDMGQAETTSKMRMSVAEARARGRDLSAGPAQHGSDIGAGRGAGTTTGGAK